MKTTKMPAESGEYTMITFKADTAWARALKSRAALEGRTVRQIALAAISRYLEQAK